MDDHSAMQAASLFDLAGQVAIVTGASSGIGARFAQVLAANGASVMLVARRVERLHALQDVIKKRGGRVACFAADVADRAAMRAAFDAAEAAFGTVTILVNNAGIAHTGRATDTSEEAWRHVLDVNLDAVFFWAQEAARRLLDAGMSGSIINTASILSFSVSKGTAAYAISKAGVLQLTKALAIELASKNIRVNAIAPGWIVTEINETYLKGEAGPTLQGEIPMRRFGHEADLDGALLLLASNAGRYMTGATVVVDGGVLNVLKG
jgi:3-oxoacyl-[acyl-carrier protein] reductase